MRMTHTADRSIAWGLATVVVVLGLASTVQVLAGPLNPLDYASLGTLNHPPSDQTLYIDPTSAEIRLGTTVLFTGVVVPQTGGPEIAVFTFDQILLHDSSSFPHRERVYCLTSDRAVALLSHGDVLISDDIDFFGYYGTAVATGGPPGPGGYKGGSVSVDEPGDGPGGGGCNNTIGSGGGGHGGAGGDGVFTPGGNAYGNLSTVLQGGSGGGARAGGGGGGALEIAAVGMIDLAPDGSPARIRGYGGMAESTGGGGAGGGLLLHGSSISISAQCVIDLYGGSSDVVPGIGGGGGGGGRARFLPDTLIVGTDAYFDSVDVSGGNPGYIASSDSAQPGDDGIVTLQPTTTIVLVAQSLHMTDGHPQTSVLPGFWSFQSPFYQVHGGATMTALGDLETLQIDCAGYLSLTAGTTDLAGLGLFGADLVVRDGGTVDVGSTSQLNVHGPLQVETGGQLNVLGTMSALMDSTNAGQLAAINTTLTFPGNGVKDTFGLTNTAELDLINVTVNGDIHSPTGSTISVAGSVVFNGLVSGAGNFPGAGLVTFNGGYDPGDSPAEVIFNGDLICGSDNMLTIELGGTLAGHEYDRLVVAGELTLDGILDVMLIDNFDPQFGHRFNIFDWGTLSGTCQTVNLPNLAEGLFWDTCSLYTTGELAVAPEPTTLGLLLIGGLALLRRRR